jgi:hypothetical protein
MNDRTKPILERLDAQHYGDGLEDGDRPVPAHVPAPNTARTDGGQDDDGPGESVIAAVDGHLDELAGRDTFEIECGVSVSKLDLCDWNTTLELDEPARLEDGKLVLPGFEWKCPECGQPWEFHIDGVGVSRLV